MTEIKSISDVPVGDHQRYLRRALAVAVFPLWFWPLVLTAFAAPFVALGLLVSNPDAHPFIWGPVSFAFFGGIYLLLFTSPTAVLMAFVVFRFGFVSRRAAIMATGVSVWAISAMSLMASDDFKGPQAILEVTAVSAMLSLYALPATFLTCFAMGRLGVLPSGWPSAPKS